MWNFFEYIVVNTVNDSKEIEGFKKNMKKVGIKKYHIRSGKRVSPLNIGDNNKCESLSAIYNQKESCCGLICKDLIKRSIEQITKAYNQGCNNILIFEDDARFELPINFNKLKFIVNWLQNNKYWEAFYFGYILHPNPLYILINLKIGRLMSPNLAHALCIHRRGMKKILQDVDKNGFPKVQIDKYYNDILSYKYGPYPAINYQIKPPALYSKGIFAVYKKLGISLPKNFTSFNKFVNSLWMLCILIILIILVILIYLILKYFRK